VAQSPSQDQRFRSVYETHQGAIRDYCFRRLAPADANDATAEVFLVVWRRIDSVPDGDSVLPWLYGIARNTVANAKRSNRRRGRLDARVLSQPLEFDPGPEPQMVQREEARQVVAALGQLKPAEQEILRLKAWEQLSNAEIAEVMDLTVRAVDTRLMRARKKLSRKATVSKTSDVWAVPRPVEEGGER
jgi:RNA polymerase sigma-70 factor (ECF subfamily)